MVPGWQPPRPSPSKLGGQQDSAVSPDTHWSPVVAVDTADHEDGHAVAGE